MTTQPRAYPFTTDKLDLDPLYAQLRREEPLSWIQLPYGEPAWLATRYEDAKVVLGDARFSRAEGLAHDEPRVRPFASPPGSLATMDAPEHSRLRRLAAKAFTVKRVEEWRPRVQRIADGLIDELLATGAPADLVGHFALPLPITVICELLGVPFTDRADFGRWSDSFVSTTKFTPEQAADYRARLQDYMAGLIAEHRSSPKDDLIGDLIIARDAEDRLSEEELLILALSILVAGFETTATQIPNFLYVLLNHPDQLAALRADLTLVPRAVEELMRYIPLGVAGTFPRYALEDIEVGGVLVRAGQPVVVASHAANRDESVFTDPDNLDLRRQESPHVGFGHGAHHCLGAPLARMELQVALHTLLTRLPGLALAGTEHDIAWKTGMATRGPERMVITWDQP